MKLAGLQLDFYDFLDTDKSILEESEVPEIIKTAHILTPEERSILRDEAYSLVMVNEGKVFRKFACIDAGNTALSVTYFLDNMSKLPEEAQKVAAANLLDACQEFGLEAPELLKNAAKSGMVRKRDSWRQPSAGDEADWNARTNLQNVDGPKNTGRVMDHVSQVKTSAKTDEKSQAGKGAILGGVASGTAGLGYNATEGVKEYNAAKNVARSFVGNVRGTGIDNMTLNMGKKKVYEGAVDAAEATRAAGKHLLKSRGGKAALVAGAGTLAGGVAGSFMKKKQSNIVDVSGLEPKFQFQKKASTRTALNGRYGLDSLSDVERAVEYFSENYTVMEPQDRHEYCVKTASRAQELGVEVPEIMARYGSTELAPDFDAHIANRKAILPPEEHENFDTILKAASSSHPDDIVGALALADQAANINWYYGGDIMDPYFAVYGGNAEAEKIASWVWRSRVGDHVTAEALTKLCRFGREHVERQFGQELTNALQKDPIAIFESLPDDAKTILARIANEMEQY